jgi:hypothetical protein
MRSSCAASKAAKLLILLVSGGVFQISPGAAATKCPSGQILRVSLGICVPKEQNLSVVSKHVASRPKPAKSEVAPTTAPDSAEDVATDADQHAATSAPELTQRDAPQPAEHPAAPPAQDNAAPFSAFGTLFVGAFRSTMSMGASAFR